MSKVAPLLLARLNHAFPSPITVFTLNFLCLEAVTSGVPAPPNFTCSLIYEEREHRETLKFFSGKQKLSVTAFLDLLLLSHIEKSATRRPSRVSLTQMAKKKPVYKKIRRVRVTEKGTLIIQTTVSKLNFVCLITSLMYILAEEGKSS